MDPVEHHAKLKDTIRALEDEAAALRETFLRPGAHLRSTQFEVAVRHHSRRVLQRDRLPPQILSDPKYWEETTTTVVLVRPLGDCRLAPPPDDDLILIEPFLNK